ncbi:hypothetical protein LTR36_004634 [Oleoguttula mirabilis]|uniref:Uncharacterized protein n=1 Tax=Oleoguttula mirabilis TaxID=1507867 RepID=A0AAV9JGF3_9PEZI|nr:hypothetical protein LTR36_004634 [Oleoguttula mirabilis]
MQLYVLLASVLPLLAAASPIQPRAGGPIAEPIPSNCTLINPLPHASCGNATTSGYMPTSNFTATNLVYSAYFEGFLSQPAQATECMQQCYGFGDKGDCKSALLGYRIPTPKGYYGTVGGDLETACLLYGAYLNPNVFVPAPSGQYVNATAQNIYCSV